MVANHKPKILKDLFTPRKSQANKDNNMQASAYVEKQKGNSVELVIKDRVEDIATEEGIT